MSTRGSKSKRAELKGPTQKGLALGDVQFALSGTGEGGLFGAHIPPGGAVETYSTDVFPYSNALQAPTETGNEVQERHSLNSDSQRVSGSCGSGSCGLMHVAGQFTIDLESELRGLLVGDPHGVRALVKRELAIRCLLFDPDWLAMDVLVDVVVHGGIPAGLAQEAEGGATEVEPGECPGTEDTTGEETKREDKEQGIGDVAQSDSKLTNGGRLPLAHPKAASTKREVASGKGSGLDSSQVKNPVGLRPSGIGGKQSPGDMASQTGQVHGRDLERKPVSNRMRRSQRARFTDQDSREPDSLQGIFLAALERCLDRLLVGQYQVGSGLIGKTNPDSNPGIGPELIREIVRIAEGATVGSERGTQEYETEGASLTEGRAGDGGLAGLNAREPIYTSARAVPSQSGDHGEGHNDSVEVGRDVLEGKESDQRGSVSNGSKRGLSIPGRILGQLAKPLGLQVPDLQRPCGEFNTLSFLERYSFLALVMQRKNIEVIAGGSIQVAEDTIDAAQMGLLKITKVIEPPVGRGRAELSSLGTIAREMGLSPYGRREARGEGDQAKLEHRDEADTLQEFDHRRADEGA